MTTSSNLPRTFAIATCVAALAGSAAAHGYRTFFGSPIGWAGGNMTLRASTVSFPSGSTQRNDLLDAIGKWNACPADLSISLISDSGSVGTGNFQNETWFSTSEDLLDGADGVCISWSWGVNLSEADVIFHADGGTVATTTINLPGLVITIRDREPWDFGTDATDLVSYGGNQQPFEPVALHELGHALGLLHEDSFYTVMGDAYDPVNVHSGTYHAYVGEDASHGVVQMYGTESGSAQDVGVSHWKWAGRSGEYSVHGRCAVRGAWVSTVDGEPVYNVNRGQSYDFEVTFENNGRSSQTPLAWFVLSTNDFVATSDDLLETRQPSMSRNTPYETTQRLVIPSSLTSGGYYWVGVLVDPNGTLSEGDES